MRYFNKGRCMELMLGPAQWRPLHGRCVGGACNHVGDRHEKMARGLPPHVP